MLNITTNQRNTNKDSNDIIFLSLNKKLDGFKLFSSKNVITYYLEIKVFFPIEENKLPIFYSIKQKSNSSYCSPGNIM